MQLSSHRVINLRNILQIQHNSKGRSNTSAIHTASITTRHQFIHFVDDLFNARKQNTILDFDDANLGNKNNIITTLEKYFL